MGIAVGDINGAPAGPQYNTKFSSLPPIADETFSPSNFHHYYSPELNFEFAQRWNKLYPFEFILVNATTSGGVTTYSVSNSPSTRGRFLLPISPQDLAIDTPFASEVIPTLGGGVIEEHSGTPFRNITLSGTTGMAPFRKATEAAASPGVLESFFSGTLQAVDSLVGSAQALFDQQPKPPNLHSELDAGLTRSNASDGIPYESTGFFQFHLLKRFFEIYAALKKSGDFPDLRLCFANHKDSEFYLVTPLRFGLRRSATRPREYLYDIQLKAWRRVNLQGGNVGPYQAIKTSVREPGTLATVLNKINQARQVLENAGKVIDAALADLDRILDIVRGVVLFAKDALGLVSTIVDMPANFLGVLEGFKNDVSATTQEIDAIIASMGDKYKKNKQSNSGAAKGVGAGAYSRVKQNQDSLDAARDLAGRDDSEEAKQARRNTPLSDLGLPTSMMQKVAQERERVRRFTRLDFLRFRDDIQRTADALAEKIGAGNSQYGNVYGRGRAGSRVPTYDEYRVLWAMQTVAQQLDTLAISDTLTTDLVLSSLQYVGGLASESEIAFVQPRSRFFVPFEYGSSLEKLALRHLGDANRWHEIATLNRLKTPYVDEVGQEHALLVNGDKNVAIVADGSDIEVGQPVWLWSRVVAKTKHIVEGVEKISAGYWRVQVSGPDLDTYSVEDGAVLHAFAPNTVNSQKLIAIPSPKEGVDDKKLKYVPGTNDLDGLLGVGGIDLLVDSDMDLVLNANDFVPAFGLSNIIQSIKLALSTPRGALLQHPDYGTSIEAGVSTADVQTPELLQTVRDTLATDPAIADIQSVTVTKRGPTMSITLSVILRGSSQALPLTFVIAS